MQSIPAVVPEYLRRHSFSPLLGTLLIMIVGAPLAGKMAKFFGSLGPQASISPFVLLLTIGASFAVWPYARNRAGTIVIGGGVLLLLYFSTFSNQQVLTIIHLAGQATFFLYVMLVVGRVVFAAEVVDGNILCGAACIYLLTGVFFGFIFSLIEAVQPGSYHIADFDGHVGETALQLNPGWLIYFSFATLTTVSFGDILPASEISRSVATLEAILGQISLVVMIARLVGLHVAQTASGHRKLIISREVLHQHERRRRED